MTKDSKYIELIHKQLTSEIGADEQALLDQWLSTSSQNQEIATEIEEVWNQSQHYKTTFQPDVEGGLSNLKARIRAEQNPTPIQSINSRRWILQIAAAVVLLIGVGMAFNYFTGTPTDASTLVAQKTTDGEIQSYTLSDGSTIWLNENSRLEYPEVFNGEQRVVRLEGEAYFDIARDESKPFLIQVDQASVKVLGTSFNVRSYTGEDEVEVTVKSGKVQFEVDMVNEDLIMHPQDCYRYNKVAKTMKKTKDKEFNSLAWQTRQLVYVNTPMSVVVEDLEELYDIEIQLKDQALENCRFTANFKDTPLKDVLDILKASLSMEVEAIQPGQFLFVGGQCEG